MDNFETKFCVYQCLNSVEPSGTSNPVHCSAKIQKNQKQPPRSSFWISITMTPYWVSPQIFEKLWLLRCVIFCDLANASNQKTDKAFTLPTFEDHQLCFYEKNHSRRKAVLKWDLLFFTTEIYHQFCPKSENVPKWAFCNNN